MNSIGLARVEQETQLTADVQDATRGDRQAYTRLVERTRNLVCSISLAIVRDLQASEDVAQEVYVAAWRGLAEIRNPTSFLPWLRQLTRNRAYDHLRSRLRTRSTANAEAILSAAADARPSALDRLVGAEEARVIAEALDALPDETRELILLYYREGQSAAQVARLLGIRQEAVKKRLSRARDCIRDAVAERFGELAQRTAPDAAFTTSVMAIIPMSAPGIAAGAGAKAASSKLGALVGAMAAGVATGVLGILAGAYLQSRQAVDTQERREVWLLSLVNLVSFSGLAILLSWASAHHLVWLSVALYLGMVGMFCYTTRFWLPRIIARRLAAEQARDPRAAARHKRQRLIRLLALVVGAICGGAGLFSGLF